MRQCGHFNRMYVRGELRRSVDDFLTWFVFVVSSPSAVSSSSFSSPSSVDFSPSPFSSGFSSASSASTSPSAVLVSSVAAETSATSPTSSSSSFFADFSFSLPSAFAAAASALGLLGGGRLLILLSGVEADEYEKKVDFSCEFWFE